MSFFRKPFLSGRAFFLAHARTACGTRDAETRRGDFVGMRGLFNYFRMGLAYALTVWCLLGLATAEEKQAVDKRAVTVLYPMMDAIEGDWSERKLVQYLEPLVQPSTFVYSDQPDPKAAMDFMQRKIQSLGCEAYARVHYGKKDLAINTGGHHCVIYRWEDKDLMDLAWEEILKKAPFNQDELPQVGEAACWTHHGLFQSLTFRKGLYIVQIECGRNDLVYGLLELANAFELKMVNNK